ncbi:MAG TPA: hypothetical protein VK973_04070 [Arenicellales bacterium]|nr:hypothetical protein [Arenicellales bacterium]
MRTHYVSFADNSVAINYENETHGALIEYLFGDLDSRESAAPLARMRLVESGEDNGTRLEQDGSKLYAGDCRATLARTLVEKTLYALVDKDESGLAFHAAAVCAGATGVLIPGHSGAGKSTLAVWLATRGFNYLTDELVHVPLGTRCIEAFTRPINLKQNGLQILEEEFGIEDTDDRILKTRRLSIVPHRLLNPAYRKLRPEIACILFPRLIEDGEHRLEPLSKAQAGLRLVECLVNGRNIANHGFDQVSRIVRDVPAYELHYTGFKTLPKLLGEILPQVRTRS